MGWRNRPTSKSKWPDNVDVIMFIDENGDTSMKNVKRSITEEKELTINNKYFTITGCVIRKENFEKAKNDIIDIKERHWKEGIFKYKDKEKRVCFHSHEIRKGINAFHETVINRSEFMKDISEYMIELKVDIFSSTLDKEAHYKKYLEPDNPYNLCMDFILERLVKFYLNPGETASIVLEARGKKEDRKLLEHVKRVIDNGTRFVSSEYFKKIKGVYFNPKWSKESDDKKSYFGLEIADLISYPIHKYNIKGEKDRAFKAIENKIYGYPNYEGKGIKNFPK